MAALYGVACCSAIHNITGQFWWSFLQYFLHCSNDIFNLFLYGFVYFLRRNCHRLRLAIGTGLALQNIDVLRGSEKKEIY